MREDIVGILIANLGTPQAPTPRALRHYLREFLSDRRVVEMPSWLWWLILHGIVLRMRPRKSAKLYQKIWTDQGSPLLHISNKQVQGIKNILEEKFPGHYQVELGMRYGSPSIAAALKIFKQTGIQKLIVLPLYPQYSGVSTGSVFDQVVVHLKKWRNLPEFNFVKQYADNPNYIAALANSIQRFRQHNAPGETLLFSFHSIPQANVKQGDPYETACHTTAALVAQKLQLAPHQWKVVFQSRFGKQKWLQPYCDKTLVNLAHKGVKRVDIICPGFAADCLETLEEIQIRNTKMFLDAGGTELNYIPALNDDPEHLHTLVEIIRSF